MDQLKEKEVRMLVGTFYHSHKKRGNAFIAAHFEEMGLKKRQVYRIMQNIDERGYMLRKTGSGGHNRKITHINCIKLSKKVNNKTGRSKRKLTARFRVSQTTIYRTIKKLRILYYKREKVPKSTKLQILNRITLFEA